MTGFLVAVRQNQFQKESLFDSASSGFWNVTIQRRSEFFAVWEPMLPTEWYRSTRPTLKRVPDSRPVQFWDKDHFDRQPGLKREEAAPAFDDAPIYRIMPILEEKISAMHARSQ